MPAFATFLQTDDDFGKDEAGLDEHGQAFEEILGLPSDFLAEEREQYDIDHLTDYELPLRVALAFGMLKRLRQIIQHRSALIDHKIANARGNKANRVAEEHIQSIKSLERLAGQRYNKNYARICHLRGANYVATEDKTPGRRLREIDLNTDLTIANLSQPRELGDSKISGSWLWGALDPSFTEGTKKRKSKADKATEECKCCHSVFSINAHIWSVSYRQWQRARAEKVRCDEAVSRLCAEFRFTRDGYAWYSQQWLSAAEVVGECRGKRAYAYERAEMWVSKRDQIVAAYDDARREGVDSEQLDHTRVSQPCGFYSAVCSPPAGCSPSDHTSRGHSATWRCGNVYLTQWSFICPDTRSCTFARRIFTVSSPLPCTCRPIVGSSCVCAVSTGRDNLTVFWKIILW